MIGVNPSVEILFLFIILGKLKSLHLYREHVHKHRCEGAKYNLHIGKCLT